ncbi:MAG: hypothetical protein V3W09_03950, partial [Nitrososphaerales archaeon]
MKSLWLHFPDDWRNVEAYITQMIMKHEGLFKNDPSLIDILETEYDEFMEVVDVKLVERIKKRWSCKNKLKYLLNENIIPE